MAAGSTAIFFLVTFTLFEFNGTVSVSVFSIFFLFGVLISSFRMNNHKKLFCLQTMAFISLAILLAAYQFMAFMSKTKQNEAGVILDSGNDLNIEGGIAEYVLSTKPNQNIDFYHIIFYMKIFQKCQRLDHSNIWHTNFITGFQLVLVLIVIGTISCSLHALGIRNKTMARTEERTTRSR